MRERRTFPPQLLGGNAHDPGAVMHAGVILLARQGDARRAMNDSAAWKRADTGRSMLRLTSLQALRPGRSTT